MKIIKVTDKSNADNSAALDIDIERNGIVYTLMVSGRFYEEAECFAGTYETPPTSEIINVATSIDSLDVYDKDAILIPLFNTPFSYEEVEKLLFDQCYEL